MLFRSDRKSTRLNSSHLVISYAVFCLKKKKKKIDKATSSYSAGVPVGPESPTTPAACILPDTSRLLNVSSIGVLSACSVFFFLNNRATPEFYPFPLHDPLPI